jgi:hypothetical protein
VSTDLLFQYPNELTVELLVLGREVILLILAVNGDEMVPAKAHSYCSPRRDAAARSRELFLLHTHPRVERFGRAASGLLP